MMLQNRMDINLQNFVKKLILKVAASLEANLFLLWDELSNVILFLENVGQKSTNI